MKFELGDFYENSTKVSSTSPEEPNVFHIVGSGVCSATIHRTRGCFHDDACNVYCVVDSDIGTSTM